MTTSCRDLDRARAAPLSGARGRIVVAMSGGVDSSVAAALLKDAGHDVVGVTLQLYDQGARVTRPGGCCAGRDIQDARRVAEHLGIPHYVLDYEDRFAREVIRPFARSYLDGETPIPCVLCNQQIKFTDLLETARELGAEALATGHYVQVRQGPSGAELLRGRDDDRDQSYFLFSTTREQLGFLRFPLGGMRKPEVRALAQTYGITVAEKPDSQDICFVPDGRYASVIEKLHPEAVEGGDIVHVDGRVLGRHKGIVHYTIGQRRGLGVASGEPMFVVRLDPALRRVVVGPRSALRADRIVLRDMNWLGDGALESLVDGMSVNVRIRSSQVPRPARLFPGEAGTRSAYVVVEDGEYGVSPGQACVVYADDGAEARVLGGGWIEAAFSDAADGAVPEGRLRPERRALG